MSTPETPLAQDGGDGQRASTVVNQIMRNASYEEQYRQTLRGFGETEESDANHTEFFMEIGPDRTRFRLTVTREVTE